MQALKNPLQSQPKTRSFEKSNNMFFYLKNLTDLKLCFIF